MTVYLSVALHEMTWNEFEYDLLAITKEAKKHVTFGKDPRKETQLSWTEKLRRRLAGMIKIRKGLTIDSGAADHVMPLGWLAWIVMVASAGSLRCLHYVAASGTRIPNLGQQVVTFLTESGTWATWTFQVAAVNKPLVSVSKLVDDGYRVVFDDEASYCWHKKSGRRIAIKRERGVFVVDAYVEPAAAMKTEKVFSRQD